MNRSGHGGDWAGYETEYGREALDYSMNVSPLGIPDGVAKAIAAAAPKANRYPDPECRRLRAALAEKENVPCDWIFCGNGAADIIDRIALGFSKWQALVTAPTFSEYEQALTRCGWRVDHLELDEGEGFAIDEEKVQRIGIWLEKKASTGDCSLVFLCEPNNPTGVTTDRGLLEKILKMCKKYNALLVIDECFNGFLDEPEIHTMKGWLGDNPNLIILKAFTKMYGMAGIRLGYCLCSDEAKLETIRTAGQPWNVSYLAEEAGIAALDEEDYIGKMRRIIDPERKWLREQLAELGAEPITGDANYLLFGWPTDQRAKKTDLLENLRERGILIRDCSNFVGLDKGWYRIAVRKHEENEKLIDAIRSVADDR